MIKELIAITKKSVEAWCNDINSRFIMDTVPLSSVHYSFPSFLRVTQTPNNYIFELLGSQKPKGAEPISIAVPNKPEKKATISHHLTPGFLPSKDEDSLTAIFHYDNCRNCILSRAYVFTNFDKENFQEKVGEIPFSYLRMTRANSDVPILITPSCHDIWLYDIKLIRADKTKVLFRSINTLWVLNRKNLNTREYKNLLDLRQRETLKRVHEDSSTHIWGLNWENATNSQAILFARDLASLADQDVSETILDNFINSHAQEFCKALGYKDALSQVRLEWVERDEDDPHVSIPDYLMQNEEGFFDILDLKKALLKHRAVTKGGKARIRFVDYVQELIAQLTTYQRYFSYPKNSQWAYEKYGIQINSPKLIGIVGNFDSFQQSKVENALLAYRDNIALIDYHSLAHILRGRN